jgi:ABC-type multidrug transport system fused ATPase/permease subunit
MSKLLVSTSSFNVRDSATLVSQHGRVVEEGSFETLRASALHYRQNFKLYAG